MGNRGIISRKQNLEYTAIGTKSCQKETHSSSESVKSTRFATAAGGGL